MGVRVAKRPQLVGCREDQVQRENRQVVGDPGHRRGDRRPGVATPFRGVRGDQREHPLTVGLTADQVGNAELGQPARRSVQAAESAVVREQPAVLGERDGCWRRCARRCWRSGRARRRCGCGRSWPPGRTPRRPRRRSVVCRVPGCPAGSNTPIPAPSGSRWLCSRRLSGASSSQKVALTGSAPACSPNSRHMGASVLPSIRKGAVSPEACQSSRRRAHRRPNVSFVMTLTIVMTRTHGSH